MEYPGPLLAGIAYDHLAPGATYWLTAVFFAAAAAKVPVQISIQENTPGKWTIMDFQQGSQ